MYIPSYDFKLFKIPNFSPLEANEYNATTQFSANTPLAYVDYSINQLTSLMQPDNPNPYLQRQFPSEIIPSELAAFFQDTPTAAAERLRKLRDEANAVLGETQNDKVATPKAKSDCPAGYSRVTPFGISALSYCGKQRVSDGEGTIGEKGDATGLGSVEKAMNALPSGSGIFLIAIVVIVLLFLFVKR